MKHIFWSILDNINGFFAWVKLSMCPTKLDISVDGDKRFRIALGNFVMVGMEQFRQEEQIELKIQFANKEGIERFQHLSLEKFNKEYFKQKNSNIQMSARTIVSPKNESMIMVHHSDSEIENKMRKEIEELRGIILSMGRQEHSSERVH